MRLYRRSPLYPGFGRTLAKLLAVTNRWRGRTTVVHDVGGVRFELDLNEVIDASLYYSGTFEAAAETVLAASVEPGMMAIDIGANVGYHTFTLAKLTGPAGRVLAIEPTTRAFTRLTRNAALNAFTNITLLKAGLTDHESGPIEIQFQSSYRLDGSIQDVRETVLLTTLDRVVKDQHLSRVDFIKMDVDGFEGKVFRGAAETLRQFRPKMLFEITPAAMVKNGDDPIALLESLRDLGYTMTTEAGRPVADFHAFVARHGQTGAENLVATPSEP
jgi:FkbM family methyltransferase